MKTMKAVINGQNEKLAKTMKRTSLIKKLDSMKITKNSFAYGVVSEMTKGELIRPCYTSGRGRFTSNQDHTFEVKNLLGRLNIAFQSGNDAPKGGKCGNYIKIITKIID